MATYTANDFLLDRANIHDTVTKLYLFADRREFDRLDEAVAPNLILDYTLMFGGEPRNLTPTELAEFYKKALLKMTTTQHTITSLVIDLPQPGTKEKVTKAKVVGNVMVNLTRKDFEGGEKTSNGGRSEIEVIKISDAPTFGNPWRISAFKAFPAWMEGNTKILTAD